MIHRRTRGAVLLARLQLRQEDIARRCGVEQAAVSYWTTGARRPRDAHRVILRDAYDIPLDAWLEAPNDYNTLLLKAAP
jgi:transcriptional regulator with XRE-family HTH domain